MATILVDYENVCATDGLKGVGYLNEKDTLILFYSQSCEKIRAEYIEEMEKSGCEFKIRKLVKTGKNALDFYIASECGYISRAGETQIGIVTKDKGFSAISDYFSIQSELEHITVSIACNIEKVLMSLNASDDSVRRRILHEKSKPLDIAVEHARIQERIAVRQKILSAFAGTEFEEKAVEIFDYAQKSMGNSPKLLYTGSLHNFGRVDGTAIYKILKTLI